MTAKKLATLSLGLSGCLATTRGFAHHAMNGQIPDTTLQGLLSGLAHPVVGIDHFAFLILVGAAAIFTSRPLLTPLAFVASTIVGCLLVVSGVNLPWVELAVTVSVMIGGAIVLSGRNYSASFYLLLFTLAGVFHGGAYGAAIVGSQTQVLLAYLLGFACVQYLLAVGTGAVLLHTDRGHEQPSLHPRLVGAVAAGVGFTLMIENIETVFAL